MALTAANIAAIEALHGPDNLYQWTNPHGTVTSTTTAVLQQAVDTCVEILTRRGYSYTETDPIVFNYCVCFLQPGVKDESLLALSSEFRQNFPMRAGTTVSTSAVAPDDSTSVSKFDDERWSAMNQIGSRRRGFSSGGW